MASPLLPREIPARLAAVIAGRSPRGFMRDVFPYCGTAANRVDTAKLEGEIGEEITPAMYLAADRRLDQRREQQRHWAASHVAA